MTFNRRRFYRIYGIAMVLLVIAGYFAFGSLLYRSLATLPRDCQKLFGMNTPTAFTLTDPRITDPASYLMQSYEAVRFPSRDDALEISGWYIPAEGTAPDGPTIIMVHGVSACKASPELLVAAGMLNRNGFNVLMIDLRDHGDSAFEDGRYAAGTDEYRDALGAWDWLVNARGVPPAHIGLYGQSLGAAVVTIAMGEEPRVAATWEDSSFADLNTALVAQMRQAGLPTFFIPGGLFMARVLSGDDLTSRSPLRAMSSIDGRPFYITHGEADPGLSVQYAYDLADALRADGGTVEPWIVAGSQHLGALFDQPEEYERRLVAFFSTSLGET